MSLVCALLTQHSVDILGISQTILRGDFTMVILMGAGACDTPFTKLVALLKQEGEARNLDIHVQRENILNAMYRI